MAFPDTLPMSTLWPHVFQGYPSRQNSPRWYGAPHFCSLLSVHGGRPGTSFLRRMVALPLPPFSPRQQSFPEQRKFPGPPFPERADCRGNFSCTVGFRLSRRFVSGVVGVHMPGIPHKLSISLLYFPEPGKRFFTASEMSSLKWMPAVPRAWRNRDMTGMPARTGSLSSGCLPDCHAPPSAGLSPWDSWYGLSGRNFCQRPASVPFLWGSHESYQGGVPVKDRQLYFFRRFADKPYQFRILSDRIQLGLPVGYAYLPDEMRVLPDNGELRVCGRAADSGDQSGIRHHSQQLRLSHGFSRRVIISGFRLTTSSCIFSVGSWI